jgi:hypothetical protein
MDVRGLYCLWFGRAFVGCYDRASRMLPSQPVGEFEGKKKGRVSASALLDRRYAQVRYYFLRETSTWFLACGSSAVPSPGSIVSL